MIVRVRGRRTSLPEALRAGPFTVVEARRYGVMLDTLRNRRRFRRLLHGVYAVSELPLTRQLWIEAAAKVLPPDAVFSHRTAARIWGIPVTDDDLIHVTVNRSTTCPRFRRIRVHQTNEQLPWVRVGGQRITPPGRTFVDLAAELGLVDLVVAGDRMLRNGLVDRAALECQLESSTRRRGARTARSAIQLLRPRVRSGSETRLRLLLVLAGLPEPLVGTDVVLTGGALRFTPALHYPQARIAIEPEYPPWVDINLLDPQDLVGSDQFGARLTGDLGTHRTGELTNHLSTVPTIGSTTSNEPADRPAWWQDNDLVRRINDQGWLVFARDTTDLWRTGWTTVRELHATLRARHQPGTPEVITRTRTQTAIGTLMDASEVAWTRVPRGSDDTDLVLAAERYSRA